MQKTQVFAWHRSKVTPSKYGGPRWPESIFVVILVGGSFNSMATTCSTRGAVWQPCSDCRMRCRTSTGRTAMKRSKPCHQQWKRPCWRTWNEAFAAEENRHRLPSRSRLTKHRPESAVFRCSGNEEAPMKLADDKPTKGPKGVQFFRLETDNVNFMLIICVSTRNTSIVYVHLQCILTRNSPTSGSAWSIRLLLCVFSGDNSRSTASFQAPQKSIRINKHRL